jgi:hypothetical protein
VWGQRRFNFPFRSQVLPKDGVPRQNGTPFYLILSLVHISRSAARLADRSLAFTRSLAGTLCHAFDRCGWIAWNFSDVDENGQRLFALASSGLTVVQLSGVPLGIGTVSPTAGPSAGGTSLTIRGSGFQSGTKATLGGKALTVIFKDQNTLTFVTPALTSGAQQLVLSNPDGESVSLDAAFVAQ